MLKLKELRGNRSQEYIASKVGLKQQTYRNYESGDRQADYDTLIKLADYFGVSLDYLLGREDTSIVKRPEYALSEKFATDYKDLLTDKNFLDITKLCSAVTPEMRAVAFGYLVAFFQSRGVNTQSILGF